MGRVINERIAAAAASRLGLHACPCGSPKSIKKILCDSCYISIPPPIRNRMLSKDPNTRQLAMDAATAILERLGRVSA